MENIVFKQSLVGFDRTQVLSFIDTLASQLKTQEAEYTEKQERLQKEINNLSGSLATNDQALKQVTQKNQELSQELEQFKKSSTEIKMQINTYRNLILDKDREIVEIKNNYNRLAQQKETLQKDNEIWQSKQNEIAACLVDANVRAKEIITAADDEAKKTKAEFAANAGQLFGRVEDVKNEISRVEEQIEASFQKLKDAMSTMDCSAKVIEEQVLNYKNQVETLDIKADRPQEEKPQAKFVASFKPEVKKTLTDSVLDTILKLLEK